MKKAHISAISAEQDAWLRRAYAEASAAAKDLIGAGGSLHSSAPIGRLGDPEWGWIASAVIWAWVKVRGQQAAEEGWSLEETVRRTGLAPCPWTQGAVVGILPKLADACPDFDWSAPASAWSKETLAEFLLTAFNLIQRATIARDVIEEQLAGKPIDADVAARRINAAAGNPRMTPTELKALDDGDCPL
jgi:hypothetical protein